MKVAVFSDNFHPETSGISDSIAETAAELARKGHTVHFFVPRYSARNYRFVSAPFRELSIHENVVIHRLPSVPMGLSTGQGRLVVPCGTSFPALRELDPDVIHVHTGSGSGIEALIFAKTHGYPLMGTNHTHLEGYIRTYLKIFAHPVARIATAYNSLFFRQCDFVTAPSRIVLEETIGRSKPYRSRVIPNPIASGTSAVSPQEARALRERFGLGSFTIAYCGRLAREKHIDVTLRAVALLKRRIPGLRFLIIGRGPAERELRRLVRELHITENVVFTGFLDKARIAELYSQCDLFVIMSTIDVQSIAALEAMANGLPVLSARAGGMPDLVTEQTGRLIPSGDYRALAKQIEEFHDNPEERRACGERAREAVTAFSHGRVAEQWEAVYQRAVQLYYLRRERAQSRSRRTRAERRMRPLPRTL